MEESLKSTQQQVVAAQERLSVLQREMRDGEAKAAKLLADARTQSGVLLAKANKEAKQLLDDAKAKVAAAARLLVSGDTAGAA
jgi:F0F1-type ATP synthase membrane subunit b/b'